MVNLNFVPFCYWKSLNFRERLEKIHVLDAVLINGFAVHHRQLGMSKQVCCGAYYLGIERNALLN